jgi:decaprenylphospho-beta-D-ribofuranose 2-oxidase
MREYKVASFLGVLKKFGDGDRSLLGFANPGWSLAIDIPAGRSDFINELSSLMDELAQIGGKVYLSKDALLKVDQFKKMYPKYIEFIERKRELDPKSFWKSDQARRLELC